ncbi:Transcriptional regulator, AsnC family [[Actinomadura] parvosata subsp. kistnae]|nr:Transcriptional regulator, AsnC family [Actinomadura parvosata subsp. kistnae]
MRMDSLDGKILAELQRDGRLTVTELAARVRLSVSSCHRRLRDLERTGAIRGYRAVVDPSACGLAFEALVFVSITLQNRGTVFEFEQAVAALPEVHQAQRLFGDPDYLLRVRTADLPSFQRFWDEHLAALPGIHRVSSTIVMKEFVSERPILHQPG